MCRSAVLAGIVLTGALCGIHSAQAVTYKVDDGTAEDSIGLTAGGTIIALNEFPVAAGGSTITSISGAFGSPGGAEASLVGKPFTVMLYSDPNHDGVPDDAVLLTTATGTITSVDSNLFVTVPIAATAVTTDFFIGYSVAGTAGTYPAALDETTDAGRSYVAGDLTGDPVDLANLSDNDIPVSSLDAIGFGGNWLIRANAVPEPSPYAMMGVGAIALGAVIRLRRRAA